jgi:phosphonopyruvate decarboxylase
MSARVSSERFVDALSAAGAGPYIGVPCSYLRPFIDYVIDRDDLSYVAATNEGEALAIAAGAQLAGRRPVVMLQNSGLGNLVNPLASLIEPFRIPVLLIITLRGDPAGKPDEPQHALMGRITRDLLRVLEVEHDWFPATDAEIAPAIARATAHMNQTGRPFAFILRRDVVTEYTPRRAGPAADVAHPSRREALAAVHAALAGDTIVVATTGKTGREWFELDDRPRNLYLVGSMGCAPSVALGLAEETSAPVLVLDGDGAALMRLEAMASVGHRRPARFTHIVLDNEAYDSTGAQRTISASVDFPGIARACGYATAQSVVGADALRAAVVAARGSGGPHFIHCRIGLGASAGLGRPKVAPHEVAERLRASLRSGEGHP